MVRFDRGLGVCNAHRQIELALAQPTHHVFEAGRGRDETNVGPALAELGQSRRDLDAGKIAGDGDPHGLRRRLPAAQMRDLIVDRQHPTRMGDDHFPSRREAHARRALVENLVAEKKLQPLDLGAHRRLGDPKRMRCLGKAALVDHGHKGPQQFSRDVQHAPSPFLCCRMTAAIRSNPNDCPLRPVPITCNVCSIPPKSSAAINVADTRQIGKYCVGRDYVLFTPAQSSRAHESQFISGPHGRRCGRGLLG